MLLCDVWPVKISMNISLVNATMNYCYLFVNIPILCYHNRRWLNNLFLILGSNASFSISIFVPKFLNLNRHLSLFFVFLLPLYPNNFGYLPLEAADNIYPKFTIFSMLSLYLILCWFIFLYLCVLLCSFGVFLAPPIYKQTSPAKGWPSQTHSTPTSDTDVKSPRHIELKDSSPIPSDAKYSGMLKWQRTRHILLIYK